MHSTRNAREGRAARSWRCKGRSRICVRRRGLLREEDEEAEPTRDEAEQDTREACGHAELCGSAASGKLALLPSPPPPPSVAAPSADVLPSDDDELPSPAPPPSPPARDDVVRVSDARDDDRRRQRDEDTNYAKTASMDIGPIYLACDISASFDTVFMFLAVPRVAAGILSFDVPIPSP